MRRAATSFRRRFATERTSTELQKSLDSRSLDAYEHLAALAAQGQPLHYQHMLQFYDIVREAQNPLATHMFASLAPFADPRSMRANVDRVIRLYLRHNSIESALAFLRDVQVANSGQLAPSYDLLESLLLSAKWHRDAELAWQVAQVMTQTQPQLYARTWGLLASVVLDESHFDAVHWVWKEACIPGYVVLDDKSYIRMAKVAAENGCLAMAQWAALRQRRRQRALGIKTDAHDIALKMYAYLIEAVAAASLHQGGPSIRAACRYLVRLRDSAAEFGPEKLPQFIDALARSRENREYVASIFAEMIADPSSDPAVCTLLMNLQMAALYLTASGEALELASMARERGVASNEATMGLLIKVGLKLGDSTLVRAVSDQMPTQRILKKAWKAQESLS